MKVSRFKVAVLVLLVATVIYPVALHLDIQRYEAWKQAELEKHPQWAGIMDFAPYTSTNTGAPVITGVLIVGFWLMVIVHRKKLNG